MVKRGKDTNPSNGGKARGGGAKKKAKGGKTVPVPDGNNYNPEVVDMMLKCARYHMDVSGFMKGNMMMKCVPVLRALPFKITDPKSQLKNLVGIGKGTIDRVTEFLNNGTTMETEAMDRDPSFVAGNKLQGLFGISIFRADSLAKLNVRSLPELRRKVRDGDSAIIDKMGDPAVHAIPWHHHLRAPVPATVARGLVDRVKEAVAAADSPSFDELQINDAGGLGRGDAVLPADEGIKLVIASPHWDVDEADIHRVREIAKQKAKGTTVVEEFVQTLVDADIAAKVLRANAAEAFILLRSPDELAGGPAPTAWTGDEPADDLAAVKAEVKTEANAEAAAAERAKGASAAVPVKAAPAMTGFAIPDLDDVDDAEAAAAAAAPDEATAARAPTTQAAAAAGGASGPQIAQQTAKGKALEAAAAKKAKAAQGGQSGAVPPAPAASNCRRLLHIVLAPRSTVKLTTLYESMHPDFSEAMACRAEGLKLKFNRYFVRSVSGRGKAAVLGKPETVESAADLFALLEVPGGENANWGPSKRQVKAERS